MIKYFRFSYDYVLWGMSWTNLVMLLSTIPTYDSEKKEEKTEVEGLDDLAHLLGNSG